MHYDYIQIKMLREYHASQKTVISDFRDYLTYERGLAQSSASIYTEDLFRFSAFMGRDLKEVTKEDIRDFIKYLRRRNLSGSTIIRYMVSVKCFFSYLNSQESTDALSSLCFFMSNHISIRRERKISQVPSTLDIEKIRLAMAAWKIKKNTATQPATYRKALRDIAVYEVLISTGARSAEVRALVVADLDTANNTIFIRKGKGGHQRVALFNSVAKEALLEHIKHNDIKGQDKIFPMAQGNLLNYIVKRWAKRAEVNPRLHPHSLRHYHITESQRQGINIQAVADNVGHVSLNTTRSYTHLDINYRREQYKDCKF